MGFIKIAKKKRKSAYQWKAKPKPQTKQHMTHHRKQKHGPINISLLPLREHQQNANLSKYLC